MPTGKTKIFCRVCVKNRQMKFFHRSEIISRLTGNLLGTGRCKSCITKCRKVRDQSLKGLISKLYSHQKYHSKIKGRPQPEYTLKEFMIWCTQNIKFNELYNHWGILNYKKWFRPSIDRIDPGQGYKFGNIQAMTWKENFNKRDTPLEKVPF